MLIAGILVVGVVLHTAQRHDRRVHAHLPNGNTPNEIPRDRPQTPNDQARWNRRAVAGPPRPLQFDDTGCVVSHGSNVPFVCTVQGLGELKVQNPVKVHADGEIENIFA